MKLIQWSYTKRYQVKAIFDGFPDTIFIFRTIGSYYFIFTSKGLVSETIPTRDEYIEMEMLLNQELQTLPAYLSRKSMN